VIAKPSRAKRSDTAAYALGGLAPARVAEPRDAAEAAALLGAASDAGETVVAYGGGTLQRSRFRPSASTRCTSTTRASSPPGSAAG
jgi:hypothetical protein